MASTWRPPAVSDRLREETARREGEAFQGLKDERWGWMEDFNRELESIMPGMRIYWCTDPAPVDAVAMGAKPGRFAIVVPGLHGAPASAKPIIGPGGSFVDPSVNASNIFESLRAQDWWNPAVRRERDRAVEAAKAAAEKAKQREREDRDQEVLEKYLAGTRTFVSMNRDTPWSQNAAGARGRKR